MATSISKGRLLLGFVALALILAAIAILIWGIYRVAVTVRPETASLLVGLLSVSGTLVGISIGKALDRRAQAEQMLRDRKAKMYEEFIAFTFRVVLSEKLGQPPLSEVEMMRSFAHFTEQLMVWGSNDVIIAFNRFRLGAHSAASNQAAWLTGIEDLFFAIRADLGLQRGKLKTGDLLAIFVNDMHSVLQSGRKH
jgi:hypothetical protein